MNFEALRSFQSRLLLAIHGIAECDLRRAESEGRWSIAQVIAHLGDAELLTQLRLHAILISDHPKLATFEPDRWMERIPRGSLAELLERFWTLRRMTLALLERLSDDELARTGEHPDGSTLTVRDIGARLAHHDDRHLGQIQRIKILLRVETTGQPDVSGVVSAYANGSTSLGPGVRVRPLWEDGVRRALQVEFDAGAQWPGIDYHVPGPEEVYVLSGDFDDGTNVYRTGAFLHHPAGSSHSPRSSEGCTLFVFYPEG